jgi:arylsulfatase A-like enzyme
MDRLAGEADAVRGLYDADIRVADDGVGAVLAMLKRRGALDASVLALTSDHGEEFGEHGGWTHDQSVYEELIHVPLLVREPGSQAARRIPEPVSIVDLMPTLARAAGLDALAGAARGLLPEADGANDTDAAEPGPAPVVAMRQNEKKYYRPTVEQRGDRNVAWLEGRWKAIWSPDVDRLELYDLTADPGERSDLAGQHPEQARRVAASARDWLERCQAGAGQPGRARIGDDERKQLKNLGYLD